VKERYSNFKSITGLIPPKLINTQMSLCLAGLSEHSNKTHITELPKFCASLYIMVASASKSQEKTINKLQFPDVYD
jgi:hypothetical protein